MKNDKPDMTIELISEFEKGKERKQKINTPGRAGKLGSAAGIAFAILLLYSFSFFALNYDGIIVTGMLVGEPEVVACAPNPPGVCCANNIDDDNNGVMDCADESCNGIGMAEAMCEYGMETMCFGGFDNDGDGLTDCDDPDCSADPLCAVADEVCNNNVDDDEDGNIDCADSDCDGESGGDGTCQFGTETTCDDSFDNDRDSSTDCDDSDCSSDPSCQTEECGNNEKEGDEVCDGTALSGQTCTSRGYVSGSLACESDCTAFDESACVAAACGNDQIEGDELCDGTALGGQTCEDEGFELGGTLSCAANCLEYVTTSCDTADVCGDGTKGASEQCDDGNTDNGDGCDSDCKIEAECGNNEKEPGEICDGTDLDSETCTTKSFDAGTLSCESDCSGFDTSSCTIADDSDDSDDSDNSGDFDDFDFDFDFDDFDNADTNGAGFSEVGHCTDGEDNDADGFTDCDDYDCSGDASCILCGNGIVSGLEECDGLVLNEKTCELLGYNLGGNLACTAECKFNTDDCSSDLVISESEITVLIDAVTNEINNAKTTGASTSISESLLSEALSALNDGDYILARNRVLAARDAIGSDSSIPVSSETTESLMILGFLLLLLSGSVLIKKEPKRVSTYQ